ncbi:hypothetical protein [Bacillus sp. FJAT-18017]|uniref:hypothetical protein n=1 Tax=Bacillus sp. FJAT-18017 TaxID=1705566 RepID=UPI000A4AC61E|nr:hypothetical protein [Bacillus sp. FJAT-18017]
MEEALIVLLIEQFSGFIGLKNNLSVQEKFYRSNKNFIGPGKILSVQLPPSAAATQ